MRRTRRRTVPSSSFDFLRRGENFVPYGPNASDKLTAVRASGASRRPHVHDREVMYGLGVRQRAAFWTGEEGGSGSFPRCRRCLCDTGNAGERGIFVVAQCSSQACRLGERSNLKNSAIWAWTELIALIASPTRGMWEPSGGTGHLRQGSRPPASSQLGIGSCRPPSIQRNRPFTPAASSLIRAATRSAAFSGSSPPVDSTHSAHCL